MIPGEIKRLSEIETETIEWLWSERIPFGSVTLLKGRRGVGKSMLACWLSAAVTRGELPDDSFGGRGEVFHLAGEDTPDVLKLRLKFFNADLSRVFTRSDVFNLDDDGIDWLMHQVSGCMPALVIIDSIASYFGACLNDLASVRRITERLGDMARECACAVVLVSDSRSTRSSFGSIDLHPHMRSVLLAQRYDDLDITPKYLLTQVKNSFGTIAPDIGYSIVRDDDSPRGQRFVWGHV